MKTLITQLTRHFRAGPSRRNLRILIKTLAFLVGMVTVYTVMFHFLMAYEKRDHTWISGLYWVMVMMSTLGLGDITFHSDLGRLFSVLVLVSGIIMLLVVLPFTFIQFFYAPWVEAQSAARAPRELDEETKGHVILTDLGPVSSSLIARLKRFGYKYVVIVPDLSEALKLHDMGINVMVGEPDDADTYRAARAPRAAMIVSTGGNELSANIAFSVREVAPKVPLVVTAQGTNAAGVLRLAGADHVIELAELMGEALSRRTIGGDAMTHVIGNVDRLLIAEAAATRTPLVGKTVRENKITELGVSVVGVWERGRFEIAGPDTMIGENTVLVLAGDARQLESYDEAMAIYNVSPSAVVLIGAGSVGRATAAALKRRGIKSRVVEKQTGRCPDADDYICGDAADRDVLERAGILEAPAVFLTTHEDNTNLYLTILIRNIRPDIQIISRCTAERNVATMHRAGADFVMSSASMGAGIIVNLLKRANIITLAEGLNVWRMQLPASLAGKTLAETTIRQDTGLRLIAISVDGQMQVNPDPHTPLPASAEILLIGTADGEDRFLARYGEV